MSIRKVGNEMTARSGIELAAGDEMKKLIMQTVPAMGSKWDVHLPLFLTAPSLARLLWLDFVYRQAVDVPGCLTEFGSQWGASLNCFTMLKLIHEPWNASRRILSFSTFGEGFISADDEDGLQVDVGDYAVPSDWNLRLQSILEAHSVRSPIGASSNFEVIAGDARQTFPAYLHRHPELVISHAHFDMDVYAPTRDLIGKCVSRMPEGAVLIFDEVNCPPFPGETVAIEETLGISGLRLRKSPYQPYSAYAIIGE